MIKYVDKQYWKADHRKSLVEFLSHHTLNSQLSDTESWCWLLGGSTWTCSALLMLYTSPIEKGFSLALSPPTFSAGMY